MTIRARLMILLGVISLALIGLTGWQGTKVFRELSEIRRSEAINGIAADFIGAAKYLAVERGQSTGALAGQAAASATTVAAVQAARENSASLFRKAEAALAQMDHAKTVDNRLEQTRAQLAALDTLRRSADADMGRPLEQRAADLAPRLVT